MITVIKKVNKQDLINYMYNDFTKVADDPKLYECLNTGKAINVFQMSAGTASRVVEEAKPDNLLELCSCNAFARPGTVDSLPDYVKGKSGIKKYHNELINSIFDETFGVCLYQEQVMQLFSSFIDDPKVGNYARGLLKKLGKANKKQEDIDAWKELTDKLIVNAKEKGVSQPEIKVLIDDVAALANYSFNKSHALAYSMMAAWTLYLNVYFKKYYYPAVLEYAFDNEKEVLTSLKSMRASGFEILPPDLSEHTRARTYSNDEAIFLGLHNVKQVGNAAQSIVEKAPYKNFRDFLEKNLNDSKINKRVIAALIEFGMFDNLEPELTRHQMMSLFSYFWENKPAFKKITADEAKRILEDEALKEKLTQALNSKIQNICDYWDSLKAQTIENGVGIKEDRQFLKDCEIKYLGVNFFVTPFDNELNKFIDSKIAKHLCVNSFEDIRQYKDISKIVPVYISAIRKLNDKNGNEMAFLTLEDRMGENIVVPLFASVYSILQDKVAQGVIAFVLLYNTEDTYKGGMKLMLGTKKWQDPSKYSSFIIPIRQEKK